MVYLTFYMAFYIIGALAVVVSVVGDVTIDEFSKYSRTYRVAKRCFLGGLIVAVPSFIAAVITHFLGI